MVSKEKIVDALKQMRDKTGQGVPMFAFKGESKPFLDELINEGTLKIVTTTYSTLPDDITVCLADNGYCVEEDEDNAAYQFMRYYIGLGKHSLIGNSKETNEDFVNVNRKHYDEWVEKNKEGLKLLKKVKE